MNDTAPSTKRYSISEAAKLLDRSPHTLRSWDRNGSMPKRLRPKRDGNGNRYWTDELIAEIKTWIEANGFHPGRGIDYHPSPEQLASHIKRIRRSSAGKARNGHHHITPEEVELRDLTVEAIEQLQLDKAKILASLPQVIERFPGMKLDDAMRIVGDVFSQYE